MKRTFISAIALTFLLVACGTANDSAPVARTADTTTTTAAAEQPSTTTTTTAADETGFPVTVMGGLGEVTIDVKPSAIVSLSPASTEILFGVGAADQALASLP